MKRQLAEVWRECAAEIERGRGVQLGEEEDPDVVETVPVDMLTCLLGTLSTRPMELEQWEVRPNPDWNYKALTLTLTLNPNPRRA